MVANPGRRRKERYEAIFLRLSRRSHGRRRSTRLRSHGPCGLRAVRSFCWQSRTLLASSAALIGHAV
jgi:hypothetical protein